MTEISNLETGLSVRNKLNQLFTDVEVTIENRLTALEGVPDEEFASRALFVTSVGAGTTWENGTIISDGSVLYKSSSGATDISDLPGFIPFGQISLKHFTSAAATGATSITAALQEAIDYAANTATGLISAPGDNKSVYIPPGLWLWDDHNADGVRNICNHPVTIYSDGPNTGTLVTNTTDEKGFRVQAASGVLTGSIVSGVNFKGLTLWNTTAPAAPTGGNSPLFTVDCTAIEYDRSMGTVENCLIYNWGGGVDCLATPEGVRIINTDINTTSTGASGTTVAGTAHVRVKVRQVDAASTGTKYQWTSGTGFDSNYYAYSNSIYIDNLNMRAGALTTIDRQEATILVEGVDGLYITNSHIAWGTLAPIVIQPRHAQTPLTNVQTSNCLIDPLPNKSTNGVLVRDFYSQTTTPCTEIIFDNCIIAGCQEEGVLVDLDMSGFKWRGGAVKSVGQTTAGAGFRITGGVSSVSITDVTFRNVGASSSDPCILFDNCARAYADGIITEGGTYGVVKTTSNTTDAVIGEVLATSISGGTTIEIPASSQQVTVSGNSQISEATSLASATTITPPLGANIFYVTGNTTIQTIDTAVLFAGREMTFVFASNPTLNLSGNLLLSGMTTLKVQQGKAYTFVYNSTLGKACLVGTGCEQGTWTPVLTDGTTPATHSVQQGRYTIIGDRIHLTGKITVTDITGMSGALRITGIPKNVAEAGAGNVGWASNLALTVAGNAITLRATPGIGYLQPLTWDTVAGPTGLLAAEITATTSLEFSAEYYINT